MNLITNISKQIVGFMIIILNILWTGYWIWLFYGYHFTSILWFFMYPDWILILNILIGLIGIYLGYRLVKNRISILMALIIDIPIFILGLIITHYVPM